VWVRAIYDPRYLPAPMLAKQEQLGLAGETLCLEGSWGAEFYGVAPLPGEFIIDKHRYSAFSGTGLDNLLRDHGVRSLIIAGVATNVCVESTLRDGFMHGYYIIIAQDCVGSHNHELHRATLENVRLTFGDVTDSAAIMALWHACERGAARGQ
jgi:ureidoacrylate peracid hydrolase